MTNDASLREAAAWTLDAFLVGTLPAPITSDSFLAPLARALLQACPKRPSRHRVTHFHGDLALALLWRSAWDLSVRSQGASQRDRRQAEAIARIQAAALLDELVRREAELERLTAFDIEGFDDQLAALQNVRSLAGVVALCLAEAGVRQGQEYVAQRVRDLLQGQGVDSHRYLTAAIGLQVVGPWDRGRRNRGWLATVLQAGDTLLDMATPQRPPTWATEAMAKAAAEKAEVARIDDGPSLLVLASVQHLPGSAEDGKGKPGASTSMHARGEWGPFAARRWPLVLVPDLVEAREILVGEFPYAEGVVDAILHDLAGRSHVWLRPVLLVGAPGAGKTRLARRLAEVLGLAFQVYGCSGVSDSSLIGTSRQWSTGRASIPLQLLKRVSAACAVMVLDEIDKAGTGTNNGSLADGILPFLSDPARIFDPYLECQVDLSGISWLATANSIEGLRRSHPALVDRFRVYVVPPPGREHLPVLLKGIMGELRAERGQDEVWCPDLSPDEAALVLAHYRGGSVRGVRRLVEAVLAGREALAQRH
ncbi:AAA family ATPase [uncultured Methylobacterium sp.]|uniref:AAA family ATPase n=1 Tax=uncultured Methylobacterium sp. TaxID=157278 RepID=UPI0035CB33FB